ncbi:hypothetical protein, partial [Listeria monocytogenes]|uniref:hypothetical protein n=1 Tax=Listeria monocytogenes TaxID=1639 RepID=UPI0029167A18
MKHKLLIMLRTDTYRKLTKARIYNEEYKKSLGIEDHDVLERNEYDQMAILALNKVSQSTDPTRSFLAIPVDDPTLMKIIYCIYYCIIIYRMYLQYKRYCSVLDINICAAM